MATSFPASITGEAPRGQFSLGAVTSTAGTLVVVVQLCRQVELGSTGATRDEIRIGWMEDSHCARRALGAPRQTPGMRPFPLTVASSMAGGPRARLWLRGSAGRPPGRPSSPGAVGGAVAGPPTDRPDHSKKGGQRGYESAASSSRNFTWLSQVRAMLTRPWYQFRTASFITT